METLALRVLALFSFFVAGIDQAAPAASVSPDGKPAAPASSPQVRIDVGSHRAHHDSDRVFYDEPGDGSIWARGQNYKASFERAGARVIPWLGAKAPSDHPLSIVPSSLSRGGEALAFERRVAPQRTGDRITFDRGSFVETYWARPQALEQTFVFDRAAGVGDLELLLEIDGDLAPSGSVEALTFDSELGGVIYGLATAIDARGRRLSLATHLAPGGIEIRVPSSFLDDALYPVTIDPVISTFSIDTSTNDDFSADVAYDATHHRYLVCYEEAFSATDHDVAEEILDAAGNFVSADYIDISGDNWRHPRVANNASANQFMVVAQVGTSPNRSIVSRTVTAGTNTLGNKVAVGPSFSTFDQFNPDIGGDPAGSGNTLYLVVWQFVDNTSGESDIVQVGMNTAGQPDSGLSICIDCAANNHDVTPAISKWCGIGNGHDHVWNVVWEYQFSPTDHDIYGAQLVNEAKITGPFAVDVTTQDDRQPSVSSFAEGTPAPDRYLVVFQRDMGPDHDILGRVMNGSTTVVSANLSSVEGPFYVNQDQLQPSADSDGCAFAVVYSEQFQASATDYDVYVSTFNVVGSSIDALEVHQNLAFSVAPETHPEITSARGGGLLHYMTVWTREASGDDDIYGGLYDSGAHVPYCIPGAAYVIGCPCSNPPLIAGGCNNSASTGGAILSASGTPSLAADTLSFTQTHELPSSLSIFLQGNGDLPAGITYGDGVRCVGGSLKRLFTHNASGGIVSAPVGADMHVAARSAALGDTIAACSSRFYQVYYRDPNLGFCPAGYNIGSGVRVLWLP